MPIVIGCGNSSSTTDSGTRETWGQLEVETFLTALAGDRHVSASTQNQALSALLFLYRDGGPQRESRQLRAAGKTNCQGHDVAAPGSFPAGAYQHHGVEAIGEVAGVQRVHRIEDDDEDR